MDTKKYIMLGAMILMAAGILALPIIAAVFIGDRTGAGSGLGMVGVGGIGNTTYPAGADPAKVGNCLDDYMQSVVPSSPLIGYGETFATAGQSYNVNPALMVAIGQQESSLGTTGIVKSHPYNYYGLTTAAGGYAEFSSWEEAINNQARYLREEYLDKGLTTIPEIGSKYAPVGASNDPNNLNSNWVSGVQHHFDAIISHCPDLGQLPTSAGAAQIVAIAQSQIGVKEAYDTCNCGEVEKYGGKAGQAWCAFFVSWVYRQAGYNLPSIGGAKDLYDWFGAHQTQIPRGAGSPQPGDVIYFSFSHVGIVESFNGTTIHTIEGNAGNPPISVRRNSWSINDSSVVGFGRWKQ